jgi:hypothetical protein
MVERKQMKKGMLFLLLLLVMVVTVMMFVQRNGILEASICTSNFIDTVRMCMLYVQEYFASVGLGRGGGYIAVGAAP